MKCKWCNKELPKLTIQGRKRRSMFCDSNCTTIYYRKIRIDKAKKEGNMKYPKTWDLVRKDITKRDKLGKTRYGIHLYPFNGRDGLQDLYEELLDAVVYLRNVIYEQRGK